MLKWDVESKQILRLIADDEVSTAAWLHDTCASLTGQRPKHAETAGS
jgi:hypothetical protein